MKADPERLPRFEGMRQHEHLSLGVGCSPDCRAAQPRIANLTGIGQQAAIPGMTLRPRPLFKVPEARRTKNDSVVGPDDREWHRATGIPPGQSSIDITDGFGLALRDRAALIQRRVKSCGSY